MYAARLTLGTCFCDRLIRIVQKLLTGCCFGLKKHKLNPEPTSKATVGETSPVLPDLSVTQGHATVAPRPGPSCSVPHVRLTLYLYV